MVRNILCVAEKPSIAKSVAQHLSGGQVNTHNVRGNPYVKNYEFDFNFGPVWGQCSVTMTSVLGHLTGTEYSPEHRKWNSCAPVQLFELPIYQTFDEDKTAIAKNISLKARYSDALFIWTDCDREGEYIGSEVRKAALEGNQSIEVKRARFSNSERTHVIRAANNPIQLDERQVNAVSARIEIDLRLGAAFTRMQTKAIQPMGGPLAEQVISYGPCQFPTLGFVVDRYWRVQNFVAETFWSIKVLLRRDSIDVTFSWRRNRLFDRMAVTILFEKCLASRIAKVSKLQRKATSKWRPLPLTTVELQKLGTMFLRMDSKRVMDVAEGLYNKGWISYPRTETDQFSSAIDLRKIIEKQVQDTHWGTHARGILNGAFCQPRSGRNNDQAHPPIHPVNYVATSSLSDDDRRVYEFVVRRFLACCSEDAKGEMTTVEIQYGEEVFYTNGLIVLERNYLDVYPYEKWTSSQPLPRFVQDETFIPTEANITEGTTTKPGYLTEPDLISLMDANGIGTDATMADHIAKIKERKYVHTIGRNEDNDQSGSTNGAERSIRGGRGGRSNRGGGRGGDPASAGGNRAIQQFIPSQLGVALIEGYDNIGLETSLGKPFLRKEMEIKMKEICAGTRTKSDVVHETLEQYRATFLRSQQQIALLKAAVQKYIFDSNRRSQV